MAQIEAAVDSDISVSSSNPNQFVVAPPGNAGERAQLRNFVGDQRALLDKVIGAFHSYVSQRFQELRFGSAVETAFEIVRREVDEQIAELVPDALPKLSAAFENAASSNPEQWANAAAGCRRLLMAAADALRPAGPPVNGRKMGPDNYVNRLIDWIVSTAESETAAYMIMADLEHLGPRLDAATGAGGKGAHAEVSRFDASRFVTGTYLLLGDILRLRAKSETEPAESGPAEAAPKPSMLDPSHLPDEHRVAPTDSGG
jgi:hypothetical protein